MKKVHFILFAAVGLFISSCSTPETDDDSDELAAIIYELNSERSSLQWTGSYGDNAHTGTVSFSEGSMSLQEGELVGGSFVVDMTTIAEPEGQGLVGHLMGLDDNERHKPEDFFNTTKFPTVKVILGDYKDGNLSIKLEILGQSLSTDVAVTVTGDDKRGSINLSGCGIIPKTFLVLFVIPAMFSVAPVGLESALTSPAASQYLKRT